MSLSTLEQAYYIAEIGGLIMVVVSLIYVGKQLSQNNRAQRISAIQIHNGTYLQNLWALADHTATWVSGLRSYNDLEAADKVEFGMAIQALLRHLELSFLMMQEDVLIESAYRQTLANANNVLSYRGGQEWWETRREFFNAEFVESLERYMSEHEGIDTYRIN